MDENTCLYSPKHFTPFSTDTAPHHTVTSLHLFAVVVLAGRSSGAAVAAVLGAGGLGGLAAVQRVRVAVDLVAAAVVAGVHIGAGAGAALVVGAVRHGGAGEGAVGVQHWGGARAAAVEQIVRVLAQAVVPAVVAC